MSAARSRSPSQQSPSGDSLKDGGEEAVTGLEAGEGAEVGAASERGWVRPGQGSCGFQAIEFGAAVSCTQEAAFPKHLLDDVLVFFLLKRASGIDEAAAGL